MVKAPEEYQQLGINKQKSYYHYRMLFNNYLNEVDVGLIRKAVHYSQPTGDNQFKEMIERKYGIKMGPTRLGRPKRLDETEVVKI